MSYSHEQAHDDLDSRIRQAEKKQRKLDLKAEIRDVANAHTGNWVGNSHSATEEMMRQSAFCVATSYTSPGDPVYWTTADSLYPVGIPGWVDSSAGTGDYNWRKVSDAILYTKTPRRNGCLVDKKSPKTALETLWKEIDEWVEDVNLNLV